MLTACPTRLLSLAAARLVVAGCSGANLPEMGLVSGMVTLDGASYPNAYVVFSPAKDRPSEGVTDTQGKYKLNCLPGVAGVQLGSHAVSITTRYQAPENPAPEPQFVEPLPAKYHVKSTLSATVQSGENEVDFALTCK